MDHRRQICGSRYRYILCAWYIFRSKPRVDTDDLQEAGFRWAQATSILSSS